VTDNDKPTKVIFAPGCFDHFEGTQEELDDLIKEITTMAESGTLLEKSQPLDIDALIDELDEEDIVQLLEALDMVDEFVEDDTLTIDNNTNKKLH
jgi:hypothetical protein